MHGPIFRPTELWLDQQQVLPCRARAEAHPEPEWGKPQIQEPCNTPDFGNTTGIPTKSWAKRLSLSRDSSNNRCCLFGRSLHH